MIDKLDSCRKDFKVCAKELIRIRDHDTAQLVPLDFNRGQSILHSIAEKQKADKGHIRILLLKARRFGGSTYVEGRYYWLSSLNSNRSTFIVGHEGQSTSTLFRMAKLMQEQNPHQPSTLASNAQELRFDNARGTGLKSEYRLATAGNPDAARSQGIHYLHDSEEAFWRDAATLLTGLFQCVPDPPAESEIFRESTANGYGNTFQEDVFATYREGQFPYYEQDGKTYAWYNPDNDWVLVFIPWFVHERYKRDFDTTEQKDAFEARIKEKVFDPNELKWIESESSRLRREYDLSLEQLHWRKWAIENKCRGSIDKFHQEYPATVEEAFLSQGTNIFPKELCDEVEALCQEPILVGDLVLRAGKTKVRPHRHGKFRLWEKPKKDETYFITVDSAGGKKKKEETDKKEKEPDFTSIDVWNHRTGAQCAQWHGHIDYDLIGGLVEMVGAMYYKAPACVELMNHGYTVVAYLKAANYPLYEHRPDNPGWITNLKTKPVMVDSLYQMARDGDIQIRCKATVSEMRTFIEDSGTYAAASGCKDDRVMTAAMGSQMMTLLPKKFEDMREKKRKPTGFNNWEKKNVKQDKTEYWEAYA